jgi:hypothetical protein
MRLAPWLAVVASLIACAPPQEAAPPPPPEPLPVASAPPAPSPPEEASDEPPECGFQTGVSVDERWDRCQAALARREAEAQKKLAEEQAKNRAALFREAASKDSEALREFHETFLRTGDPHVEEARQLARERHGLPPTSKEFLAQQRKVARLGNDERTVALCNVREGVAEVAFSVGLSKLDLGLGLFGGKPFKAIEDAQKKHEEQAPKLTMQITKMIGVGEVRFASTCAIFFWYLTPDKPAPPVAPGAR